MLKIGLTGGIGSGKSTISKILKERKIPIIDADLVAREVFTIYPEILEKIRLTFGDIFFDERKNLKRKEFGNYIFASVNRRKTYEDIIIPFIKKEIFNRIKDLEDNKVDICIVDAPTLIENNLHKRMDLNILIWVDYKTQINRVIERDKLKEKDVKNRIKSQMSLEEKSKFVDYIIDNSKDLNWTLTQVDEVLKEIGKNFRGVKCLS